MLVHLQSVLMVVVAVDDLYVEAILGGHYQVAIFYSVDDAFVKMDRGVDDMAGAVVFEVLDMVAVQNDDGGGGDDDSDDDNVDGCYYLDQVQDSH